MYRYVYCALSLDGAMLDEQNPADQISELSAVFHPKEIVCQKIILFIF